MTLTDKTLEHFLEWKVNNKNLSTIEILDFKHLSTTSQNALIIEFFDSVEIYINVLLDETNNKKFKYLVTDFNIRHLHCWTQGTNKDSRQEATEQAIIKANDIYNERFR